MLNQTQIFEQVLEVINEVQKTALSSESVDMEFYLSGELGIDSRNMLEIWYELENRFKIKVHDHDKRDMYTLKDVVTLLEKQLHEQS